MRSQEILQEDRLKHRVEKKRLVQNLTVIKGPPRSSGTFSAISGSKRGHVSQVSVWQSVCVFEWWGLILGKSEDSAKAKSYFKASPACPAPHTAPLLCQAAVAQHLGQVWRGLFREQREVLAPGHFTPNELLQR